MGWISWLDEELFTTITFWGRTHLHGVSYEMTVNKWIVAQSFNIHFHSWRIKDQLDVTCYFISLAEACNMDITQTQPHQIANTMNQEQNDQCGNSTAQSQAPDDGYINVQNMLHT